MRVDPKSNKAVDRRRTYRFDLEIGEGSTMRITETVWVTIPHAFLIEMKDTWLGARLLYELFYGRVGLLPKIDNVFFKLIKFILIRSGKIEPGDDE